MMYSACSLLTLAFATLLSFSAADSNDIFVKVLVTEADKLTKSDVAAIRSAEESASRRSLRSESRRLDPAWCDRVCRNWPYPYCQIWQPQCYDHRRQLVATEDENERTLAEADMPVEVKGSACNSLKKETLSLLEDAVGKKSKNVVKKAQITCYEF